MSVRVSATEATLDKGRETALDSVRRLEARLEDRRGAEEAAASRVAAAREEAGRLVREARKGAEREAAERRRAALARAEEEAVRVLREAEVRVERLRVLAGNDRPAAARILPGGDG